MFYRLIVHKATAHKIVLISIHLCGIRLYDDFSGGIIYVSDNGFDFILWNTIINLVFVSHSIERHDQHRFVNINFSILYGNGKFRTVFVGCNGYDIRILLFVGENIIDSVNNILRQSVYNVGPFFTAYGIS